MFPIINIENIIIHHEGGSTANGSSAVAIERYHKGKWNMASSIGKYAGYHYIINRSGKIIRNRRDNEIGAHCKSKRMNFKSIGICLVGNFDKKGPEPSQIFALRDLLKELRRKYNLAADSILGHGEVANDGRSCPGKNINIKYLRRISNPSNMAIKEKINSIINALKKIND